MKKRGAELDGRLERLLSQARAVLLYERIWPAVVAVAGVAAIFYTVSWLGVWLVIPAWARISALAVMAVAFVVIAIGVVRASRLDRAQALARLDRDSGLPHRAVSSSQDALANAGSDPATRALWDLHRRRLQSVILRTRVAPPSPRMVERDRYAVRAAVLAALVAAAFVAGPEKGGRVAAAFLFGGTDGAARGTRIDAWIDPPGYTGKPPIVLLGQGLATAAQQQDDVAAPSGSAIVVRAAGDGVVDVASDGGLKPDAAPNSAGKPAAAQGSVVLLDKRFCLGTDGHLTITKDGITVRRFTIKAVPDLPPRITLAATPSVSYRGTLGLAYTTEDDYGVAAAEARFVNPMLHGHAVTGRTLVEPPKGPLELPPAPGGLGQGKTTLDLSDHPWAGVHVTMTLVAHDEGGNTGESAPLDIVLPAKPFINPLARALVEQRRDLVLDPDDRARVAASLDALDTAPDTFDVPLGVHLGLRAAQTRLDRARTDADLLGVADLLWAMALQIENGDLSQTEQDLRAAQKALQEAMDRGASPDEIRRLTEALRQQMSKFLSEMAKNSEKQNRQQSAQDQHGPTVTERDLKSMMDRMEDAARRGDMAEAQKLLDQLNGIMNNLKSARRNNGPNQTQREMNHAMSDLDRMMRDQSDVRDKTFQQGNGDEQQQQGDQADNGDAQSQDQGSTGSPSQDGQPGAGGRPRRGGKGSRPSLQDLEGRQEGLSRQLQALQKRMKQLGAKGEQGFDDAQDAMKQAEGALGKGQNGVDDAVEAQGRALDGLQRGRDGLGQQMAQGNQDGSSPGQAQGMGESEQPGSPGDGEDLDPLGRPRQGRGLAQGKDLDVSGGLAARAQQVMEELRRRLADPSRSQDETDYLERLLKRY